MTERPYLASFKTSKIEEPVRGSQPKPCAECHEDVWVSPATMKLVREHDPLIVCMECLSVLCKGEVQVEPASAEQQKELEES